MTFEEWVREFYGYEEAGTVSQELCWNAAQQAEREKYQELIAAAEAAVESYRYLDAQETEEFYKLRELLERIKEKP